MGFTKAEAQALWDKVSAWQLDPNNLDNEWLTENEYELFCNLIAGFMRKFKEGED